MLDQRLGSADALSAAGGVEGFPEVGAALSVEPEVGGVAEDAGEDEGGIRCDGATISAEFVDVLAGQAALEREFGLSDAEGENKFLQQHFAGGYWLSCFVHRPSHNRPIVGLSASLGRTRAP